MQALKLHLILSSNAIEMIGEQLLLRLDRPRIYRRAYLEIVSKHGLQRRLVKAINAPHECPS
ncbi:hypothetical protein D3C80_2204330 [compost metagenome]